MFHCQYWKGEVLIEKKIFWEFETFFFLSRDHIYPSYYTVLSQTATGPHCWVNDRSLWLLLEISTCLFCRGAVHGPSHNHAFTLGHISLSHPNLYPKFTVHLKAIETWWRHCRGFHTSCLSCSEHSQFCHCPFPMWLISSGRAYSIWLIYARTLTGPSGYQRMP